MIRILRIFTFLAPILLLSLPALSAEITICGTGDNQALLRSLARAFEAKHPGVSVDVPDSIGSSGGIKETAKGKCDLGRVARPLKEKEAALALNYLLFARSPVVFLANKSVYPVQNLTTEQAVGIFSGKITSWISLGGPDEKIYVANREKGDSSRSVLEKMLPGFAGISKMAGKIIYSTPETMHTINTYKYTIGYGPLSQTKNRSDISVLELNDVAADVETIQDGSYPLFTPFGLVWTKNISSQASAFLDFLKTSDAATIINAHGAVPVLLR